jgi:hypothetical protein
MSLNRTSTCDKDYGMVNQIGRLESHDKDIHDLLQGLKQNS